jgi:hypothetical protein
MSTGQIAFDLARVVVAGIGLTVAAYQVRLAMLAQLRGERLYLITVGLTLGQLCAERLARLGEPASWRLAATFALVGLFTAATMVTRREGAR